MQKLWTEPHRCHPNKKKRKKRERERKHFFILKWSNQIQVYPPSAPLHIYSSSLYQIAKSPKWSYTQGLCLHQALDSFLVHPSTAHWIALIDLIPLLMLNLNHSTNLVSNLERVVTCLRDKPDLAITMKGMAQHRVNNWVKTIVIEVTLHLKDTTTTTITATTTTVVIQAPM